MTKIETAKIVADKLFATEDAIDTAMVQSSELLSVMVSSRKALKLSAMAGEVAQSRAAEAIAALAEARRAVMAAHGALANLQRKMDIDDADVGPLDKPDQKASAETAPLRVAS